MTALAFVFAITMAGCSSPDDASEDEPQYTGMTPGSLTESTRFDTVDLRIGKLGATSFKISYRSTSGVDDSSTEVTGSVFVPAGAPPTDGWDIVAYGHGTTGVLEDCAPSMYSHLIGSAPSVAALVNNGYVVVMPDYQGLGSPGPHPYLEPRTVGYNMIDAVRAAHELMPDSSTRWVSFGGSQGGQASWAANELATSYGDGLNLLGSVALAPAANMSGLAADAAALTLSPDQLPLMQFVVNSLADAYPDVVLSDYLHGGALANNAALLQCSGTALEKRNELVAQIVPDEVAPATAQAESELAGLLEQWSLPLATDGGDAGRTAAPMLVVQGDNDTLVRWPWTLEAVRQGCARGDVIEWSLHPGEGHGDLDTAQAFAWMRDRFAGVPAADSCAALTSTQDSDRAGQLDGNGESGE